MGGRRGRESCGRGGVDCCGGVFGVSSMFPYLHDLLVCCPCGDGGSEGDDGAGSCELIVILLMVVILFSGIYDNIIVGAMIVAVMVMMHYEL